MSLVIGIFLYCLIFCDRSQAQVQLVNSAEERGSHYNKSLDWEWEIIGPFPAGMREQGGDPLSPYYPLNQHKRFPSELADGGYVYPFILKDPQQIYAPGSFTLGPIEFDQIRWRFNRYFYGWTVNQWQGWASTALVAKQTSYYMVHCSNIVEFDIDGEVYYGDRYAFDSTSYLVFLTEGQHSMRVRLSSEIRIFGGSVPPPVTFRCYFNLTQKDTLKVPLTFEIQPDVVSGLIAGYYASFTAFNELEKSLSVSSAKLLENDQYVEISLRESVMVVPGQSREISITISQKKEILECPFVKKIQITCSDGSFSIVELKLDCKKWGETYVFTFKDFDNTIHYASARPPIMNCSESGCPILLSLHGAAVDAKSQFWTDSYLRQNHTWLLFPTGRTTWGFDWHGSSKLNVENSILDLSTNYPGVPSNIKDQLKINPTKIFFAGHSNGGQGCWFWISHYPDLALAATPVSGYLKIHLYVPYFWRNSYLHMDPFSKGILESSISEFDNDLYASNMVGIPILTRTGGLDTNVPPINTRRLFRLVNEFSSNPEAIKLSEIEGGGHFFDGIMDDEEMQNFIDRYTDPNVGSKQSLPPFPSSFIVTTMNPASSGSKGSIRILQLIIPYRLSTIKANITSMGKVWNLVTKNVKRFSFSNDSRRSAEVVVIDGQSFSFVPIYPDDHFCKLEGKWTVCEGDQWELVERSPLSYGPILQIYEAPILIVVGSQGQETEELFKIGVKISNGIFLYGRGSVDVIMDYDFHNYKNNPNHSNLILIGSPQLNSVTSMLKSSLPVQFNEDSFSVGDRTYSEKSTGVIFLGPWQRKLLVVIAGTDFVGTHTASLLFPYQTGVTLPDYAVVSDEFKWKGSGSFLASGFWSNNWTFDSSCGFVY